MTSIRQRTPAAPSSPVQPGFPSPSTSQGGPGTTSSRTTTTTPSMSAHGESSPRRRGQGSVGGSSAVMYDPPPTIEPYQLGAVVLLAGTVLTGTLVSLLFSSSSVTSFRGRLPASSSSISFSKAYLPGALSGLPLDSLLPHYFANKRNVLNVLFVKKAWLWTTLAWGAHWIAGLLPQKEGREQSISSKEWNRKFVYRPIKRYAWATVYWLLFTTWFFGPSFSDRVLVLSGAECVPSAFGSSSSANLAGVPNLDSAHAHSLHDPNAELDLTPCQSRPDDVFLPETFEKVKEDAAHGASGAGSSLGLGSDSGGKSGSKARARTYWRGGHDISGHTFLLTLSSLLLLTEIAPTLSTFAATASAGQPGLGNGNQALTPNLSPALTRLEQSNNLRKYSAVFSLFIVGIWWWMLLMTSLFFHTPQEKATGFIVGLGAWWSSWKLAG